jgi:membrane associated rhomboid family serine protease
MREMTKVPQVTYALIAINVLAYLAEGRLTGGAGAGAGSVYVKGALLGSSAERGLAGQGVAYGQWWRILTGGFLHANFLHIAFNMYLLYVLGQILEPALGRVRFAMLYFVSLLTGSLVALIVSPHDLTVGASGAVFGLMAAVLLEARARQIPQLQNWVAGLILFNLAFSFVVPGISWGGHVGGLIGGALCMLALQLGDRHRQQLPALAACIALGVAAFAGGIATAKSSEVQAPLPGSEQQLFIPSQ